MCMAGSDAYKLGWKWTSLPASSRLADARRAGFDADLVIVDGNFGLALINVP